MRACKLTGALVQVCAGHGVGFPAGAASLPSVSSARSLSQLRRGHWVHLPLSHYRHVARIPVWCECLGKAPGAGTTHMPHPWELTRAPLEHPGVTQGTHGLCPTAPHTTGDRASRSEPAGTAPSEQGAAGDAGAGTHHLMKCTLLFPCRTTKPKGVKAKNAAFPDTSWKTTPISHQNV